MRQAVASGNRLFSGGSQVVKFAVSGRRGNTLRDGGEMASGKKGRGVTRSSTKRIQAEADHCRDTALRLRDMAEGEPIRRLRTQLLDLARQYEDLAAMFLARLSGVPAPASRRRSPAKRLLQAVPIFFS